MLFLSIFFGATAVFFTKNFLRNTSKFQLSTFATVGGLLLISLSAFASFLCFRASGGRW